MSKTALFPGSFDPITVGHIDVVLRSLDLFDRIVVGVGQNTTKQYMFPLADRMEWIIQAFADYPQVEVHAYSGLTVNY